MKFVSEDLFRHQANMMAKWVHTRNNSFRFKFKRNRKLIFSLVKNDPMYLLEKIGTYAKRRLNSIQLKRGEYLR